MLTTEKDINKFLDVFYYSSYTVFMTNSFSPQFSQPNLVCVLKNKFQTATKTNKSLNSNFFLYALQLQEKCNITLGQSSVKIHRVLNSLTFGIHHFKLLKQQVGTKGHSIYSSVCVFLSVLILVV